MPSSEILLSNPIQSRNLLIDRLKGFAIILVVLGHLIQFKIDPVGFDKNTLFRLIYSFHMALFFFLAGQVFKLRPLNQEILLSFKRLIIPFVVFFFIISCHFDISIFLARIPEYFINPELGFWFLLVLAFIRVISSSLLNQNNPFYIFIMVILFSIVGIECNKRFAMHLVLFYMPFFMIGFFSQKYDFKEFKFFKFPFGNNNNFFYLIILMFMYLMFFPHFHRNPEELWLPFFLIQKTVLAILGVALTYLWFFNFRFWMIDKWLEIAGRHSLFIYGFHLLFLPVYKHIGILSFFPMVLLPILIEIFFDRINHIMRRINNGN